MRIGILWKDGDITLHVNLEQAITAFCNGIYMARSLDSAAVRPSKVMYFSEDNKWKPLKMTEDQISLAMYSLDIWLDKMSKKEPVSA